METSGVAYILCGTVDSSEDSEWTKDICRIVLAKVETSFSVFTWQSSD